MKLDYQAAIHITDGIYWIGFYDEAAQLHCNPYLLIEEQEAVLFDPGSIPHFPIVMHKLMDIVDPGRQSKAGTERKRASAGCISNQRVHRANS